MDIITKKDAINKGLIYYFTGKPCKHGHICERMVKGGACKICKNNFGKIHRLNNVEKIKQWHKDHHIKTYTKEKRRLKYIKHASLELLNRAKYRAKKKNLDFNLQISDIIIPEYCPILGIKISFDNRFSSPSLDRVDNSKGYIKGNVMVISNKANTLKNNGSLDDFIKIINYMREQNDG